MHAGGGWRSKGIVEVGQVTDFYLYALGGYGNGH